MSTFIDKDFESDALKIHLGSLISNVGTAFSTFAIPLFIYQHTENVAHVGMQWATICIARVFAGYIAPRLKFFRTDKHASYSLDLFMALAILLPLVVPESGIVVACYLANALIAIGHTIQSGFLQSLVHSTASTQGEAKGASQWLLSKIENGRHSGMLLGFMLAGFTVEFFGFHVAIVLDALTFLLCAGIIYLVKTEGLKEDQVRSKASYSILMRPNVRPLLYSQLLTSVGLFGFNAVIIVGLKRDLEATDLFVSWFQGAAYAAYVIGTFLLGYTIRKREKAMPNMAIVLSRYGIGASIFLATFADTKVAFLLVNALVAILNAYSLSGFVSFFHNLVSKSEVRGVSTARIAVGAFAGAIGAALASLAVTTMSFNEIALIVGTIYFVGTIFTHQHVLQIEKRASDAALTAGA